MLVYKQAVGVLRFNFSHDSGKVGGGGGGGGDGLTSLVWCRHCVSVDVREMVSLVWCGVDTVYQWTYGRWSR